MEQLRVQQISTAWRESSLEKEKMASMKAMNQKISMILVRKKRKMIVPS